MEHMLEAILLWCMPGLLGGFGGVISYFWPPTTEMRFSAKSFAIKFLSAFFVGKACGYFIPMTNEYRSGYLMVLGFCACPVLGMLEVKVKGALERFNPPGAN